MAEIYLMSQRKKWHHDIPDGWVETHFERFDYVECGIFTKPDDELTAEDKELVAAYSDFPDGWIHPASHEEYESRFDHAIATATINPPTIECPTARLRFTTRYEPIHGHDSRGNEATIGQRRKQVLQQLWEITQVGSFGPHRTEWRDVPTDTDTGG